MKEDFSLKPQFDSKSVFASIIEVCKHWRGLYNLTENTGESLKNKKTLHVKRGKLMQHSTQER